MWVAFGVQEPSLCSVVHTRVLIIMGSILG